MTHGSYAEKPARARAQTKDGLDFIRDGFDVDLIVELFEALCDDGRFPGTSQTLDVKHDVPTVMIKKTRVDFQRSHGAS